MILRLLCPSGHVLDVDARLAGRKIRCGACGKIMIVPLPVKGPVRNPARPPAKPIIRPSAAPPVKPPAKPIVKPQAAPPAKPQPQPPAQKPTAEPPPPTPPNLPREPGMVAVPLPPVEQPKHAAEVGEAAVARWRSLGLAFSSWLAKLWPVAERHLPADATIPGTAERRIALRLAAVPAGAALVSLLPVIAGHANLLAAPAWALAAVFLAVLQLVYAAWMINAPDWAAARVQMVVCTIVTTIYGMLMTLTMITPVNHPLMLDLGGVRSAARVWCGLMLVLMGAATWFCGRASVKMEKSVRCREARNDGDHRIHRICRVSHRSIVLRSMDPGAVRTCFGKLKGPCTLYDRRCSLSVRANPGAAGDVTSSLGNEADQFRCAAGSGFDFCRGGYRLVG